MLQVFAPDLADERNRRTEHDGQPTCWRELLDDAQRYARLARAAGQDDSAAGLAQRQTTALRAFLFPEDAHAAGDGFLLHAGLALQAFIPFSVRQPLIGFLGCGVCLPLLLKVAGDVDQLEGLRVHRRRLRRAAGKRVGAIGDNPAFSPDV